MIKYLIYFFAVLILWNCKSNVPSTSGDLSETSTKLYTDTKQFIPLPQNGNESYLIKSGDFGSLKESLLLGKLITPSHLKLPSATITLTQVSMQAATNIETGFFQILSKQSGKYALVRGNWDGGTTIYQADIVCVLDRELDKQMKTDLESGKLTLGEICK